ncbi:DUF3025 domain-containing protein [Undibacterium cyanobacteriorum]|uniref:DUF3025 domain-containing protein n=1 Tax=Undibacterium cyanobacteriorum TaxID=3073561 RepID=A0ABY9RG54_9BURK|nr:DUF3025 domain-containing protein [Undibacterium sp. 20NA77.5]WMW80212.1 DUF3025 domain-containing protein [Undibacterium sp. 20NA77.5]
MSRFFADIDWTRAWYASVYDAAQIVIAAPEWRVALNHEASARGLRNHRDLALHFIPQEALPDGVAYEAHIGATGGVPTRENLHDFFNALVWLSFPKIKRQLNALQAAQIDLLGIGKSRGPARDAATIFDENAALLVLEDSPNGRELCELLRQHQWLEALHLRSKQFQESAQVWSFGHALMEKLVQPYKGITAHSWVVWAPSDYFDWGREAQARWLDETVSQQLCEHDLTTADYMPLPVAGVPNWVELQDADFYRDKSVFRDKRLRG